MPDELIRKWYAKMQNKSTNKAKALPTEFVKIANKNRIIRSQYTRRENKVHKLWEKFYDDVTDVVAAEYNLPTDVAKLVVQQVRDRDIGRSELASYLDHYAIFAETVLDAVF